GRASPCRSAWPPANTIPIIVPRKNAVVTQPYQASPPRSASTSGRIVTTASDSNATSVTIDTSPIVSARCSGENTPTEGWPEAGAAGVVTTSGQSTASTASRGEPDCDVAL